MSTWVLAQAIFEKGLSTLRSILTNHVFITLESCPACPAPAAD